MNPEHLKELLQDVADHAAGDIHIQGNAVVFESYLPRRWPQINWDRLLALYGDHPEDWSAIIAEYIELAASDPPDQDPDSQPQPPALPLQVIGHARDLFSDELRPVYNREPLPGETLPPDQNPAAPPAPEQPRLIPPAPQLEPRSRADAYEQEARIVLDRCLRENETWELHIGKPASPEISRHIIGSRDAIVAASHALDHAIKADAAAKEQAWTDANVLLGDAGIIMAQAMIAAHSAEANLGPDAENPAPRLADAAWRDLQRIEAVADTARTALAYWQGREDAIVPTN